MNEWLYAYRDGARQVLLLAADAALTPDEMRELAGRLRPLAPRREDDQ